MKHLMLIGAAFAVLSSPAYSSAPRCQGPNGRFVKCPPTAAAPAAGARCKGANGRFAKCGTPGARLA